MAIRPLPVIRQRDVRERRRGTSGTSHHEQNAGWGSFCVTRCALQGTQHHAKPTRTDERISAPRIGPVPVTGTLVPCLSDVASFEHDESDDDHADGVAIESDEPTVGRPGSRSTGLPGPNITCDAPIWRLPVDVASQPPFSHCVFGRCHGHHPDHYLTTPARQQHATDVQRRSASSPELHDADLPHRNGAMRRCADTALDGFHGRLQRPERRFRQTLTTASRAATRSVRSPLVHVSRCSKLVRHEIAIREACVGEEYNAMGRSYAMERRLTMTVEEAAEIIGISRTSAYLCAARGELPTRRFGRRVLVLVAPFLAMLGDETGVSEETDQGDDDEDAA